MGLIVHEEGCDAIRCTCNRPKNENKQIMAQTFCHELLHALFFSTGRVEDHNEVLIDGLAHSLHQFLVEMYED